MKINVFATVAATGLCLFSQMVGAQTNAQLASSKWSGTLVCSELMVSSPNPSGPFSVPVTISVVDGKGGFRLDSQRDFTDFVVSFGMNQSVTIVGKGSSKTDSTRRWIIDTSGKVIGNTIQASGSMYNGGVTIRKNCAISLNQDSESRPPAVAAAPKAEPGAVALVGSPKAAAASGSPAPSRDQPAPRASATQVTTNPIDLAKKTSGNEVWIAFNPSISVQERQFCRIIENFRTERAIAEESRNQIKVNTVFRNLTQSLASLLPDGKFQGWVMRTVLVAQASNGSAEVLLELPCNVYVGSNACDPNPANFYGTAPEGSRIYSELAKMTVGDFALTSGQFVFNDDKAFDSKRSVASFRYLKTGAHCQAKLIAADADFFGLNLEVLSTIK